MITSGLPNPLKCIKKNFQLVLRTEISDFSLEILSEGEHLMTSVNFMFILT